MTAGDISSRGATDSRVGTADTVAVADIPDLEKDPYLAARQYSLGQIFGVWAAAAIPMAVLAWVVAPLLADQLSGPEPLGQALLICLNVGLVWILALTLLLVKRERGSLRWPDIRDALWLRPPRDPKTRRVGGKVWWWVVPFVALSAAINLLPIDPTGPMPRDFKNFIDTHRAEVFFQGAWGMFTLTMLLVFLSPIVEELFFRGLLLPRMRDACGRRYWAVNGVIFAAYHLHQPWSMPASALDGVFAQAYPAHRFRSIWISLITHTAPSFLMIGVALPLVLK
jgi:membrane protease YdiL (CAAX protease family)